MTIDITPDLLASLHECAVRVRDELGPGHTLAVRSDVVVALVDALTTARATNAEQKSRVSTNPDELLQASCSHACGYRYHDGADVYVCIVCDAELTDLSVGEAVGPLADDVGLLRAEVVRLREQGQRWFAALTEATTEMTAVYEAIGPAWFAGDVSGAEAVRRKTAALERLGASPARPPCHLELRLLDADEACGSCGHRAGDHRHHPSQRQEGT